MAEIKVGDRVKTYYLKDTPAKVIALHGTEAWVKYQGSDCCSTYSLTDLTLIPPEPKYKVGDRVTDTFGWAGTVIGNYTARNGHRWCWVEFDHEEDWCHGCLETGLTPAPACCK